MVKRNNNRESFIYRGVLYALSASIVGIIIFARRPLLDFSSTFAVQLAIVTVVYSIILVAIPAIVGGAMLAKILKNDHENDRLALWKATLKGTAVAMASVSLVILFVAILMEVMIWSQGRGSLRGFLIFSTEALLIATLAGALVGNRLAAYLKNQ